MGIGTMTGILRGMKSIKENQKYQSDRAYKQADIEYKKQNMMMNVYKHVQDSKYKQADLTLKQNKDKRDAASNIRSENKEDRLEAESAEKINRTKFNLLLDIMKVVNQSKQEVNEAKVAAYEFEQQKISDDLDNKKIKLEMQKLEKENKGNPITNAVMEEISAKIKLEDAKKKKHDIAIIQNMMLKQKNLTQSQRQLSLVSILMKRDQIREQGIKSPTDIVREEGISLDAKGNMKFDTKPKKEQPITREQKVEAWLDTGRIMKKDGYNVALPRNKEEARNAITTQLGTRDWQDDPKLMEMFEEKFKKRDKDEITIPNRKWKDLTEVRDYLMDEYDLPQGIANRRAREYNKKGR